MNLFDAVHDRVVPTAGHLAIGTTSVLVVLGVAFVLVAVEPLWRVVRLVVTLVHELGHAVIGVLVGRQFTGFVLRGDMSGHAVTRGPARGPGRVASTWAGYPAPALVGALMVWAAGRGWSAPLITAGLVILLFALVRVRSALTVVVMLVAIGGSAALWWWRDDTLQAQVLIGLGVVLLVGAWRHLLAVLADRSGASDPAVLGQLTHLPRILWNLTFVAVCALATWVVGVEVWSALS
ncbi:M50 family metallopeptidase [Intrasporangium flavum]|uniref:M50 family metallopeptidase n=1 Tax=Intrasporangium flavum TaxID=1428657 RepID=UPI00096E4676|nr:M50 family metallopeptidase [Intrasporangium flavum]